VPRRKRVGRSRVKELLENSRRRGEVISMMTMSMSGLGGPAESILNEVVSQLNARVDFLEEAVARLAGLMRRGRKR